MNSPFANNLGNIDWLRANEAALKDMLPETWTDARTLNGLKLGFALKLLGVDWRSEKEFGLIMVYLERVHIMLRQGLMVKRNPDRCFSPVAPSLN